MLLLSIMQAVVVLWWCSAGSDSRSHSTGTDVEQHVDKVMHMHFTWHGNRPAVAEIVLAQHPAMNRNHLKGVNWWIQLCSDITQTGGYSCVRTSLKLMDTVVYGHHSNTMKSFRTN